MRPARLRPRRDRLATSRILSRTDVPRSTSHDWPWDCRLSDTTVQRIAAQRSHDLASRVQPPRPHRPAPPSAQQRVALRTAGRVAADEESVARLRRSGALDRIENACHNGALSLRELVRPPDTHAGVRRSLSRAHNPAKDKLKRANQRKHRNARRMCAAAHVHHCADAPSCVGSAPAARCMRRQRWTIRHASALECFRRGTRGSSSRKPMSAPRTLERRAAG